MANAFLDSGAGWFNSTAQGGGFVVPGDTFDFFQVGQTQHALYAGASFGANSP